VEGRSKIVALETLGLALSQFLLLASGSAANDAAIGAGGSGSVGILPGAGSDSSLVRVTGATGWRRRTRRSSLRLRYRPRLTMRLPAPSGEKRPLLLHQADLRVSSSLSPRVGGSIDGTLAAGAVDYATIDTLFEGSAAANIPAVVRVLRADGGAELRTAVSPRLVWLNALRASYTKPLGDEDPPDPSNDPDDNSGAAVGGGVRKSGIVALRSSFHYTIESRNSIGAGIEGRHVVSDFPFRVVVLGLRGMWGHVPASGQQIAIEGGVNYAAEIGDGETLITPSVSLSYRSSFSRMGEEHTSLAFSLGMRDVLEPLVPTYRSVVFGGMSVGHGIGRRWDLGASVSATTSVLGRSLGPSRSESALAASFPVTYSAGTNLLLSFGLQSSVRISDSRRAQAQGPQGPQVLALAFFGMSAATGTRPRDSMWLWR